MLETIIRKMMVLVGWSVLTVPVSGLAQPTVTLSVADSTAAESDLNTEIFAVSRSNDGDITQALNVFVQRSGSATINADYSTLYLNGYSGDTYYVQIPANQLSQTVTLTPVFDEVEEGDETAAFILQNPLSQGHDYTIGAPSRAEITIRDFVDVIFSDSFED